MLLPAMLTALCLSLLALCASAGAVVSKEVPGTTVGLQPRSMSLLDGVGAGPESFANPGGDPVLASNKTYAIYWDPTYHYHNDWEGVIDGFFHNMGAASGSLASVFAVDTQYTDAANQHAAYQSTFMGAYTDTDLYPNSGNCTDPHPLEGESYPKQEPDAITCLTNAQIETELKLFIADHKLPTGMGTVFYLLTPPGVTVCLDKGGPGGHCSDFNGTTAEITDYEEARETYPERLAKYEKEELPNYEKELAKYEQIKKEKEKKSEPDEEEPPVKPVKPVKPTIPASYEDYKNSFCSYHADVNPGNPVNGSSSTILYAAVPWIAGGFGDGHLAPVDQTTGYDCQDGGFNPTSKPIEEKEKVKPHTKKEEEEFAKESSEEKRKREEAEALGLEKPHEQEPNQDGLGPDGYYDTGLADLIISQIGAEQQNIVTDPLLNAWQDSGHKEATDECRDFFATAGIAGSVTASPETFGGTLSNQTFGGGNYYMNDAFNLASLKLPYPGIPCLSGINLAPKFTSPNPVNSGEIVGFNGMESNITLNEGTAYTGTTPKVTYATYKWNFGDGSPEVTGFAPGAPTLNSPETSPCPTWLTPCAASTYHAYQYGGAYNVTLTVTDTGGNTASVTEPITVAGAGPPSGGATPPGGSPGATPTTSGTTTAGTTTTPPKPTPSGPVASAAVVSHSLSTALKHGLVVRYSVNEQVAGRFEVLLAASIAKRIGLHGALATGLAPGTPPQIVIAASVLVTTKGGQNTIKLKFGKKTAAKLRKLRKVSLMVRLVVRGSARGAPSTTVLSTVTLSR